MKKTGAKSTEFWVVIAALLDLFMQRFGVYERLSPEQLMSSADQVQQIAHQLQGETGSSSSMIYLVGAVYVAGRSLLKWQGERKG